MSLEPSRELLILAKAAEGKFLPHPHVALA